jgi:hypothetical protein
VVGTLRRNEGLGEAPGSPSCLEAPSQRTPGLGSAHGREALCQDATRMHQHREAQTVSVYLQCACQGSQPFKGGRHSYPLFSPR